MISKVKSKIKKTLLKRWGLYSRANYARTFFSQEGEDILLWKLIDNKKGPNTFVDVGCNHPFHMSNTAYFYERGWSGIAIDPNPAFSDLYREFRPRDLFINCGISLRTTNLDYFQFEESLYNTFDPVRAATVAENYSRLAARSSLKVCRLDEVLNSVWPNGNHIRLLSVDCEGYDHEVIGTHDFDKFPVEYCCIEANATTLREAIDHPCVKVLSEMNFVPVSKLCNSIVLVNAKGMS